MISGNFDKLHIFDDKGYEIPLETLPQFVWSVMPIKGYMGILDVKSYPSGFVYSDSEKKEFGFRVTEYGHISLSKIEDKTFKYITVNEEGEEEEHETFFNDLPKEERLRIVTEEFQYRWLESVPLVYILNGEYYSAEQKIEYVRRPRTSVITKNVPILNSTRGYEPEPDKEGQYKPLDFRIKHLVFQMEEIDVYGGDTNYGFSNYEYRLVGMSLDDFSENINTELKNFVTGIKVIFNNNKELWPYRLLLGSYDQEPVSSGLVSANTWFILEENDKREYVRPIKDNMSLVAKTLPKGELRFIENSTEVDAIEWKNEYVIELKEYDGYHTSEVPHGMSIGFLTDSEGAFENPVYLYMRDDTNGREYYFGTIMVNSESEGEDERFRTMFTNLGIPDPIDYTQLFKELDPLEEGVDHRLVNRKSKELFLSYTDIFPYIGTYKALINAVKFLGYTDIIFKEWYKIYDANQKRNVRVSTQIFDSSTGEFLSNPLKRINAEYGDFLSSKKLNEISMMYLINQKGGDTDTQNVTVKSDITGNLVRTNLAFDVPWTEPVYEYINSLVLTKLYSLKSWIEKYILGVNARIIDITGEGVYFGRFKNTVWEFGYETYDFLNSTNLTPKFVTGEEQDFNNPLGSAGTSEMKDSSARITCTLNEIGKSRLEDFGTDRIDSYVTQLGSMVRDKNGMLDYVFNDYNVMDYRPSYRLIEEFQPVSTPVCAVMDTDEFQFELVTDCRESAALQEWCQDSDNPLWCRENELVIYDRDSKSTALREDKLPTFDLEIANIRRPYGNWLYNIEWTIKKVIDSSGMTSYVMQNVGSMSAMDNRLQTDGHILLEPIVLDTNNDTHPSVLYTQDNKWNLPLLTIGHYTLNPRILSETFDPSTFDLPKMGAPDKVGTYILEIVEGVMRFPEVDVESAIHFGVKERVRADLNFSDQNSWEPNDIGETNASGGDATYKVRNEQEIFPTYTYRSERQPLYTFNTTPPGRDLIKEELLAIAESAKEYRTTGGALSKEVSQKRRDILVQLMKDEILPLFGINTYRYDENHVIDELQELIFDTKTEPTLETWEKACTNKEGCKELAELISEKLEYVQDKEHVMFCLTTKIDEDLKQYVEVSVNRFNRETWKRWQAFLHSDEIYNLNDRVDMWVNHTGDYKLSVKGFDRYNTTFFNTCGQTLSVRAHQPDIDIYVNSENSGNEEDFFRYNKDGELSEGEERDLMLHPDPYPMFPRLYRVPWFYVGKENGLLTFDSISYVLDTPKKGDTFFVNNFTERCVDIDFGNYTVTDSAGRIKNIPLEKNEMKLIMLDENPCKQNLYIEGATLNVYVYDNRRLEVIYKSTELTVFCYHKVDSLTDTNYYADSWIAVRFRTEDELVELLEYRDALRRGELTFYVGNVTEFEISSQNIHNDPKAMTSRIEFQIDPKADNHFNEGDVIKLQYSLTDKVSGDFTRGEYLAQTTHRVLESLPGNIYVIDGLVNERMAWDTGLYTKYFILDIDGTQIPVDENFNEEDYIDPDNGELMGEYEDVPFDMTIRMSRANTEDVQYILDVETDGVEEYENSGYNETHNFQITFTYNNSGWFAGDFIDAGYSGYVTDYDPQDLRDRWSVYTDDTKEVIDLWRYTEFPVSVNDGQLVVANAVDRAGSFKSFQTEWEWNCRAIGKNAPARWSMDDRYGTTLFRCANETLSVVADMTGNNDIKATITDPFGNSVTNPGQGRLFVRGKESED